MNRHIYIFSIISLLFSIGIGLFIRLQINGVIEYTGPLDFRRAHTHMGFYLVFFPIIWLKFKPHAWSPKTYNFILYLFFASLALFSFLFLGYGLLSKILSGVVLLFWLAYSIINLKKSYQQRGSALPFLGIILASGSILLIVFLGIQGEVLMAKKAVRIFMTCLLWGVFVPYCLEKKKFPESNPIIWHLSIISTALFVFDTNFSHYFLWGPTTLGLIILFSVYKNHSKNMMTLQSYWVLTAIALLLFGLGILPNHHAIAVGGIHFLILGPIFQTLFDFKEYRYNWVYHIALGTMVSGISIPTILPQLYIIAQPITNLASICLVLWLTFFLLKKEVLLK